jgi:peroxiredoxin
MTRNILLALAFLSPRLFAQDDAESTLVKVGDAAPAFSITTIDGSEFSTGKLKGKVILLNFFATWCGPCLAELPHLEAEVWQKFRDRGLKLVLIGREHNTDDLVKFKAEQKLTMPFAADPKREVYAKYANEGIPRNVLIGIDGKVKFQSVSYDAAEFAQMEKAIESELAQAK